jgi:hypothetical protein
MPLSFEKPFSLVTDTLMVKFHEVDDILSEIRSPASPIVEESLGPTWRFDLLLRSLSLNCLSFDSLLIKSCEVPELMCVLVKAALHTNLLNTLASLV